jgi:hypothetical protein
MKSVLAELALGNDVQLVGKGDSMDPIVKNGETVKITPYNGRLLKTSDIVLVRMNSKFLTHQVLEAKDDKFLIGNAKGKSDGWVTADAILGIIIQIGNDESFTGVTAIE